MSGLDQIPFYGLGQQEQGQGCIRYTNLTTSQEAFQAAPASHDTSRPATHETSESSEATREATVHITDTAGQQPDNPAVQVDECEKYSLCRKL